MHTYYRVKHELEAAWHAHRLKGTVQQSAAGGIGTGQSVLGAFSADSDSEQRLFNSIGSSKAIQFSTISSLVQSLTAREECFYRLGNYYLVDFNP